MQKLYFCLAVLSIFVFCGCANTYGLTEEQQVKAIEKYPPKYLNIVPTDSVFMKTMKITGRVLLCPLTLGAFELVLLKEREVPFKKYADYLYYNSFFGKPCAEVIKAFGAPLRVTTDGKGGNIYVWEKIYTTGGNTYYRKNSVYTTPLRLHKDIKEFYFTSDDKCYHWRTETE